MKGINSDIIHRLSIFMSLFHCHRSTFSTHLHIKATSKLATVATEIALWIEFGQLKPAAERSAGRRPPSATFFGATHKTCVSEIPSENCALRTNGTV